MGGGRKGGPVGTGVNSPAIDSGTLARATNSSPLPLGSREAGSREAARKKTGGPKGGAPKGYIVAGRRVRRMLPTWTWDRARARIDELFRDAGGLKAVYVGTAQEAAHSGLTDAVVECFSDSRAASSGFRTAVYNRLTESGKTLARLRALAKKFDQPDHYSVDAGRSYTVKGVFIEAPYRPQLVCVSHGVISVTTAFGVWSGLLVKRTNTTLATIGKASRTEQLELGTTLGNLIAHELRHQLGLSDNGQGITPVHTSSGLGQDGADFNNPKIKFTDSDAISRSIRKLRQTENDFMFELF
jgi:hypothetical protein